MASPSRRWRRWLEPPAVLISYLSVAQLSRLLVQHSTKSAPVWPPSAIGLAAALLVGPIPTSLGIFGGSLLHLGVMYLTSERYHRGLFLAVSPAFAAINVLEALLCRGLVRMVTQREKGWFETGRDALLFFIPLPIPPLLSGYALALLLASIHIVPFDKVGKMGVVFWLGRLGGMYALSPALLHP